MSVYGLLGSKSGASTLLEVRWYWSWCWYGLYGYDAVSTKIKFKGSILRIKKR
jgi:hypothetical protein